MAEGINKFKLIRNIIAAIFILVILSGIKLQIFDGAKYYRLSEKNRIRKRYIAAPRGKILDRTGREMANTRPGFYVSIIQAIADQNTKNEIMRILDMDENTMKEKLKMEKNLYMPVKIGHDIAYEQVAKIEEKMDEFKGIEVGVEPARNYPYNELLCHLLGYVGEITNLEIARDSSYAGGNYVGKMGLEKSYEKQLRGTDGIEYIEVDARGREVGKVSEKRPIPVINGADISTTIDLALTESVAVYLKEYKSAACVALDPQTGEILILYSKPGFDPNLFSHGLQREAWQKLNNDPAAPLYDRATMSCYPCGSTFKPFIALAALDSKMISKEKRFEPCYGEYKLGRRVFKCWEKHGSLDLTDAIIHSCDIYFYQLGRFIGIDTIVSRTRNIGLGKLTGIDIPNEKSGILPDRKWFERHYGKNWTEGHIFNLSIGQGDLLVTPLQLAGAFTVFANEGRIPVPHLIKGSKSRYTTTHISKSAIDIVKECLRGVVSAGTGGLARISNIEVCGKTGTAQNPHGEDHALFVGFAPAAEPKILVCVLVENAGHGGSVAAPIAGKIMNIYLSSIAQTTPDQREPQLNLVPDNHVP